MLGNAELPAANTLMAWIMFTPLNFDSGLILTGTYSKPIAFDLFPTIAFYYYV